MSADPTAQRLRGLLTYYAQLYPTAWREAEGFRRDRVALGSWPDWCWVPMAGAYATVSARCERAPFPVSPLALAYGIAVLAALIAWRLGQGVYRFDPELLAALWATPISGDLPGELLFRLPEYGVYIEAPADTWYGERRLLGAFAHLEWDMNHHHAELRLLLDLGTAIDMVPLIIHLGGTLEEGLRETLRYTTTLDLPEELSCLTRDLTREVIDVSAQQMALLAQPVVSCLLYLCSEGADYAGAAVPGQAKGRRLRSGSADWRPPANASVWNVGVRMGAALRQARKVASGREGGGTTGRQVQPHLRRAHWHTFLTGPRDGYRQRVLRWLPPIPVNLDPEAERPVVIHPVDDAPRESPVTQNI